MEQQGINPESIGWTEVLGPAASNPAHPRSSGYQLPALGKTWTVSSCENRIKAQFEQWVRQGAEQAIREAGREGRIDDADNLRQAYLDGMGARSYTWNGKAVRAARKDEPGIIQLLFLLLRRCHPDITYDVARAIFYDNTEGAAAAYAWSLGNSDGSSGAAQDSKAPAVPQETVTSEEVKKDLEEFDRRWRETREEIKRGVRRVSPPTTLDPS